MLAVVEKRRPPMRRLAFRDVDGRKRGDRTVGVSAHQPSADTGCEDHLTPAVPAAAACRFHIPEIRWLSVSKVEGAQLRGGEESDLRRIGRPEWAHRTVRSRQR